VIKLSIRGRITFSAFPGFLGSWPPLQTSFFPEVEKAGEQNEYEKSNLHPTIPSQRFGGTAHERMKSASTSKMRKNVARR